jgi:AraC-like DNA-binding protein
MAQSVSAAMDAKMAALSVPSASMPMFQFSTAAFAGRERLSAWREVFGRTVCSLDIEPLEPASFSSDATVCQLPGLGVLYASSGAMALAHTRQLIVDGDLSFMAAPTCRYRASQLGRTIELEPGAGVLMTNAEVGSMHLAVSSRFVTFRVPRDALAPLVRDVEAAVARRIPADNPALKLLVGYLEGSRATGALSSPALQHVVVTHIYDLLAIALGATRDAAELAHGRGMRAARLHAAKTFIRHQLGRHDLSVTSIAAQLGVTPRYVHMLFETEGVSFTKFMVDQRLERADRMLRDPRFSHRTISAIAFESGFNDLSHFNRTFRRHFGRTPSQVRRGEG